ncbi:MAG TPA: PAS domain S-box protein, partial [Gemmatimonadaceae bacterium]|nr:PAS domain S-box protein [Gemmatimonadaceae bacterium]
EFFGVTLEQVRAGGWASVVHPDDASTYLQGFASALREAKPFRAQARVRRADGAWRWVESYGAPRIAPDGAAVGMAGSSPDVTETKEADDAVRASEERLHRILRHASAGLWEWRPGEETFTWSDENHDLFGVPRGERLSVRMWPDRIAETDLPRLRSTVRAVIEGREPEFRSEFRVHHPTRGTRWVLTVGRIEHRADGAPPLIAGLNLDITERKRAEEAVREQERRYRSLFESTLDAVYVTRHDGAILDANRAACELHQMTVEEIRARGRAGLVVDDEPLRAALDRRAAAGGARGELTMRRKDGSTFPVEVESVIVDSRAAEFTAFVVARDVSERKRAERDLRDADRRKAEFLGVLSHELRNPLAPIRNSIYLLEHAAADSEQVARAREVLRRQTEHLTRLVDDLLDITRISRGKIQLQRGPLDLREIVRKTTDDLHSVFERAHVQLGVEYATIGPVWIDADPTRMAQVLANLLTNAVKFTAHGGAVTVRVAAASGVAQLSVRDTGVGIEPEAIERMFEPFTQAERTLARTQGGLGLGLALVRGLVELHGGTIDARSEGLGRGAEFVVHLPLASVAAQAPSPADAGARAGGLTILVIEDNPDAGETLVDILALSGNHVRIATDGRSGVALAHALRPDVVLCDIGLPDIDGYEVARALRTDAALERTQLIALSGYAQPEDRERGRTAGFDAHLAKPPDVDELLQLLRARSAGTPPENAPASRVERFTGP